MRQLSYPALDIGWYALLSAPQREQLLVHTLARQGVYAFYPVTKKWRKRRSHNGRSGSFEERPILPGYVFSKFMGLPMWHIVRKLPHISGVLGHLGVPFRLTFSDLRSLHSLRRRAITNIAAHRWKRVIFATGDKVQITEHPAFHGFVREIGSVDNEAELAYLTDLGMLGKPVPIPFEMLARV